MNPRTTLTWGRTGFDDEARFSGKQAVVGRRATLKIAHALVANNSDYAPVALAA